MKKWILTLAWVFVGLLGVSAFVISTGNNSSQVEPSASSYAPSGASALADLLRLRGYQVVIDSYEKPKLAKGDVVVAFELPSEKGSDSLVDEGPDAPAVQQAQDSIKGSIGAGGLVFWLPVTQDFNGASASAKFPVSYKRIDGSPRTLSGDSSALDTNSDSAVPLVSEKDHSFVTGDRIEKGYSVTYSDGIGLTNRFLDKGDNAQTFLEILKSYAPEARRVVFTEATFGKITKVGFLETLGPWAEGSWYQLLFLIGIVVISWNQRFGLPVRMRRTQTGGRELVDALTDTMTRAHATGMSLESAYNRADSKIRKIVKLPRDASEGERDRVLPQDVLRRLADVRAASTMDKVRPADALDLTIKLEKSVDDFAGSHGIGQVPQRRRKKSA